jgi:hypothetical protein
MNDDIRRAMLRWRDVEYPCDRCVDALAENLNYGWTPRSYWERRILAPLIASHRQATGAWYARAGIEVLR